MSSKKQDKRQDQVIVALDTVDRAAAEVMVKGDEAFLIRERETLEDLVRGEKVPEFLT